MRSTRVRRVVAIALVLLGAAAVAASGSSAKSGSGASKPESTAAGSGGSHPATADVVISKCALASNDLEGPDATLTVTNHSSKASDFIITIAYDSPDGKTQLDTGNALVNNLAAGQNTSTDAPSLKSEIRNQKFVCNVADVTRTSAVG